MLDLLKNLYHRAELVTGKRLYLLFGITFTVFLLAGLFIGYFTRRPLNSDETKPPSGTEAKVYNVSVERKGRITFTDPAMYPKDKVKYVLIEETGEEVPVRSTDDKLELVQGLDVVVSGKFMPSKDGGKDVLVVEEVIIRN